MKTTRRIGGALAAAVLLSISFAAFPLPVAAQMPPSERNQQASGSEAQSLNDLLVNAQADIGNKEYAAAAEKYEAYLAKRPQDAQIHFQLGYAYTAMQEMPQARSEYKKATELDPNLAPAFLNLGLAELDSDPAAAVAPLERAAQLMPDQERTKLIFATALARSGKIDEAIVQYQAAEKLDANDSDVHFALAQALLAKGRAAEAEQEFRSASALDPQEPQGHLGLGECLLAEKKYGDGAAELAIYLNARPGDEQARLTRVSALIQLAKYDDALAELDRAGTSARASLPSLQLRYNALEGAKRYDEAFATLTQAESVAPQDAEIHSMLGQAEMERKDYAHAAQEFLAVLKIKPQDANALAGIVTAEYLAKDYAGALQATDFLAKSQALSAPTLFVRADCYDKLGEKPEALDAYERFLAANKDQNSDMYFAATERVRDLRHELGKNQK